MSISGKSPKRLKTRLARQLIILVYISPALPPFPSSSSLSSFYFTFLCFSVVELDDYLAGMAVPIIFMEGGIESGFNHVKDFGTEVCMPILISLSLLCISSSFLLCYPDINDDTTVSPKIVAA